LKQNNIVLQRTNEKLLELDKLKSEFLANTSHELRTPLTSIIGYSQCVLAELDGPIPDKQKVNMQKVIGSGKDLLALINRLLDFSKIESGELRLDFEEMNLKDIVEEAITTVRPLSEDKGLSLITNIEPDLPHLLADRMRIKQAILNLLSNAVKFTDEGFVWIKVFRNNGDIQVSVQDTGIGIGRDHHGAIFDAFRQVDGSAHRRFGGSGLGLTISKTLIELHRGRIWVESDTGKGTTFSFTLPIAQEENGNDTCDVRYSGQGNEQANASRDR
jgi:signal transduction histidine kinase